MAKVVIYTKPTCGYCVRAKQLLTQLGAGFDEIDISVYPERRAEMIERSQRHTVPQIWIDDQHIGGCDELQRLHAKGGLVPLLAANN